MYTRVSGQPTLAAIVRAMAAGRNFVTSGALLLFQIERHQVGEGVELDSSLNMKARVTAWASGQAGEFLTRLELLRNGEVVKSLNIDGHRTEFSSEFGLSEAETAWYIARCWGSSEEQVAITNPIYFERKDFKPPDAVPARVLAVVKDKDTSKTLAGQCEVIRMVGRTPLTELRSSFEDGKFALTVPGTSRIRVEAPGYVPQTKSVFLDHAPLLDLTLSLHSEQLTGWNTFETVKALLSDIRLDFALTKQA